MKIVIQGYTTCCQNDSGGVQNRLRKIATLLSERGINVELFNPFETKLRKGDILHVFMLNFENSSLIQYAKAMGLKIVISTIVPMIDENKLRIYKLFEKIPLMTTYKLNKRSLNLADCLITESQMESDFIEKHFSIDASKMQVIPNGIDLDTYDGDDIYKEIGPCEKYVLMVGRFDSNKNQLNVIKALKGKEFDVVLIGGAEKSSDTYFKQCIDEATGSENIHFLGWVDSKSNLLRSAYAHADTVVLASFYETFGLTAIEGGSKGTKLVFSKTLPILKYPVFHNCLSFNPSSVTDIESNVCECVKRPKDERLREELIKVFNWVSIIDRHLEIYNML